MPLLKSQDKVDSKHHDIEKAREFLYKELETLGLYRMYIDATRDVSLKKLLEQNMDEGKNHAVKLAEWIKNNKLLQRSAFNSHD